MTLAGLALNARERSPAAHAFRSAGLAAAAFVAWAVAVGGGDSSGRRVLTALAVGNAAGLGLVAVGAGGC